jgi:fatty-acyl-CoA synthase
MVSIPASAEERRAAIESRHPQWVEWSLDSYLCRVTPTFVDRPLVITEEKTLTYGEAGDQKKRVASALRSIGVTRGERVGILMINHADVVPIIFAIWSLGAIAVPFNTLYRPDELAFVLRQSGCSVFIAMKQIFGRDITAELDGIEPDWRQGKFSQLPELKRVLIFNGEEGDPDNFLDLVEKQPPAAAIAESCEAGPSDPAIILYTSGTSGAPKGVLHSHDSLLRAAYCNAYHHAFEDGRRAIFSLPLYHTYGAALWFDGGRRDCGPSAFPRRADALRDRDP